jgi:hypothetical protein
LGHTVGAVRVTPFGAEQGTTQAERLCLDESGHGRIKMVSDFASGRVTCDAPATAAFGSSGTLIIQRPNVMCSPAQARTNWMSARLNCTRRNDSVADCSETTQHGTTTIEYRRAH